VEGEIRFEHVYFSYDRKYTRNPSGWVMKDMDFAIHAGETVALVGASGSGKSTILSLISKLYVASRGVVRIDGVDIRELDRESIRGHISVVTQNPYLFQMSIRDNLRLVKPDLTEEEMRDACRMASIDQDIMVKPEGYDSLIDENGVNFSGGQRQRLAIARALLKDSSVLILDEATSALDNVTQEKVRQAINAVGKSQKTVIIVAHRLSTVAGADRILMIDQGRVLDQGTHQELLARCGAYRRLYEAETESDAEQVQGRSG
jgi:ABC-type multidrug transport system fused ATPase/permease subunit